MVALSTDKKHDTHKKRRSILNNHKEGEDQFIQMA